METIFQSTPTVKLLCNRIFSAQVTSGGASGNTKATRDFSVNRTCEIDVDASGLSKSVSFELIRGTTQPYYYYRRTRPTTELSLLNECSFSIITAL